MASGPGLGTLAGQQSINSWAFKRLKGASRGGRFLRPQLGAQAAPTNYPGDFPAAFQYFEWTPSTSTAGMLGSASGNSRSPRFRRLARRNRQEFPWGRQPQLDWTHPALGAAPFPAYAPGYVGSVMVADAQQATMRDLLTQQSAVPSGTVTGSQSPIGPLVTAPAGTNYLSFPFSSVFAGPHNLTIAAIGIMPAGTASETSVIAVFNPGFGNGLYLQATNGSNNCGANYYGGGNYSLDYPAANNGIFSTTGWPYFAVFTGSFTVYEPATGGFIGPASLFIKNLWTGQVYYNKSQTQDSFGTWQAVYLLGYPGTATGANSLAAFSATYAYLTNDQCLQWLDDPYGLWYADQDYSRAKSLYHLITTWVGFASESLASILRRHTANAEEDAAIQVHGAPNAEVLAALKRAQDPGAEYLLSASAHSAAAAEDAAAFAVHAAPNAEALAALKRSQPAGDEYLLSVPTHSAAAAEKLTSGQTSTPGQGEKIDKTLIANAIANAELKGLASVSLAGALQAEFIANLKGNYLAADEADLSLKRNAADGAESTSSAKSQSPAAGEESLGIVDHVAGAAEGLLSQRRSQSSALELLRTIASSARANAETVTNLIEHLSIASTEVLLGLLAHAEASDEYVLGVIVKALANEEEIGVVKTFFNSVALLETMTNSKANSAASGETTIAVLSRASGALEGVLGLVAARVEALEKSTKLLATALATEESPSALKRSVVEATELTQWLASSSPGEGEYAHALLARAYAIAEELGVTRAASGINAPIETTLGLAISEHVPPGEALTAILRDTGSAAEDLASTRAARATEAEAGAAQSVRTSATGENSTALKRSGASAIELARGIARATSHAAELSLAIRASRAASGETTSSFLVASLAANAETLAGVIAQLAEANEALLNFQAVNGLFVAEEIGVLQAFLASSAANLELIAQRLAALSRATDQPMVLSVATATPAGGGDPMIYTRGKVAVLTGTFKDASTKAGLTPTSLQLFIQPPGSASEILVTSGFANPSAGVYQFNQFLGTSGVWRYRWEASGSFEDACEGALYVPVSPFAS